jgi:hypothetical protein
MGCRCGSGNGTSERQVGNSQLFEQMPEPNPLCTIRTQRHVHPVAMVEAHRAMEQGLTQRTHRQGMPEFALKLSVNRR